MHYAISLINLFEISKTFKIVSFIVCVLFFFCFVYRYEQFEKTEQIDNSKNLFDNLMYDTACTKSHNKMFCVCCYIVRGMR